MSHKIESESQAYGLVTLKTREYLKFTWFMTGITKILFLSFNFNFIDFEAESVTEFYLPGGLGKRAWNSNFSGGFGKRAWNSGFTGEMTYHICNVTVLSSMLQTV